MWPGISRPIDPSAGRTDLSPGHRNRRGVRVDVDVDVDVDLDGDDDVDGDARSDDAQNQNIFVNTAKIASRSRMPPSYRSLETSFLSFITSSDAAHSIASPRAIL